MPVRTPSRRANAGCLPLRSGAICAGGPMANYITQLPATQAKPEPELSSKVKGSVSRDSLHFWATQVASFLGNARSARMNNPSTTIKKGVCRRSLLKTVPAIAGAIISTTALAESLFAQTKLTHEAAKYQDSPKDGQQCSGCVQFVAPASCKVVEDPVAASGWCQLFIAKPA